MKKKLSILTNGLIRENPVLVLVLGTCPTLATTVQVSNAIGMGLAATMVLICSNAAISLLRHIIPEKVRIPCYIVLIAGFVTVVQMLVKAFVPTLNDSLGIFLPLIVVNCIILGRAEMFASKNSVSDSVLDGIGMGLGFTLTLCVMSSIREVLGNGTWMGYAIPVLKQNHVSILTMAPGGFFVFGCLIALVAKLSKGKNSKNCSGCEGCPAAAACGKINNAKTEEEAM